MISYDVELDDRAQAEIEQTYFAMSARAGSDIAMRWYDLILQTISEKLSWMPSRYAIADDATSVYPGRCVRRLLIGAGRSAIHVYYHVIEPQAGEDCGIVRVLTIRHAVMRPLGQQRPDAG